jgi:hypothetical protein
MARDLHGLFDTNANRFFKQKSLLMLYPKADWLPEKIPDEDDNQVSMLGMIHIGQTKHIRDPATGRVVSETTSLVSREKSIRKYDGTLLEMSSVSAMLKEDLDPNIGSYFSGLLPSLLEG